MTTANMTRDCLGNECVLNNYDFMDSLGPSIIGNNKFLKKEFNRDVYEVISAGAGSSHGNNRIRLLFKLIRKVLPLHKKLTVKFGYNYVSTSILGNTLEVLGDNYYLNDKSYRSLAGIYLDLKNLLNSHE